MISSALFPLASVSPAAATDTLSCLREHWRELVTVTAFAGLVAVGMTVMRRAVRAKLEPHVRQVSFGGLFVTAALLLLTVYLIAGAVLGLTVGQSVEQLLFSRIGGLGRAVGVLGCLSGEPGSLWSLATPLYFAVLYASIHVLFIVVVFLLLWGVAGSRRARGSETCQEPSDERSSTTKSADPAPTGMLAPVLAPVFQLFGYWLDLKNLEKRHRAYFGAVVFTLVLFKWVSLPAAFVGTLPATLWIVCALVVNSLRDNLETVVAAPAEAPDDKEAPPEESSEPNPVSIMKVMDTVAGSDPSLDIRSVGGLEAIPSRLADSTLLTGGPVMALISQRLGLGGSLYAHQEACHTHLSSGENVLLATSPLSGKATTGDLLALDRSLTQGDSVLYLCPDARKARQRWAALDEVAAVADWRWNLHIHDLANQPPEKLDLQMRQPSILLLTPKELHEQVLPNGRSWDFVFRSLGLVIATDIDTYTGAAGTNLYWLARRLQKVCRRYGSEPNYFCTAIPYSPDIRPFGERLLGVPLAYVGPSTDTAPQPSREVLACRALPAADQASGVVEEVPPGVRVAGQIVGMGHTAELMGFDRSLTAEEMDRIDEVLLAHGKARFRSSEEGVTTGAGARAPGRRAEVVIAEVEPDKVRLMTELTRHYGGDLEDVAVKLERERVEEQRSLPEGFSAFDLGLDERSFALDSEPAREEADTESPDAGRDDQDEDEDEQGEGERGGEPSGRQEGTEENTDAEPEGDRQPATDPEMETEEDERREGGPHFRDATGATILIAQDQPFVGLLMSLGLVGRRDIHPYLRLGCELPNNPENQLSRKKNLRCALAEASWSYEEAVAEFGRRAVQSALSEMEEEDRLARTERREVDEVTGLVKSAELLRYVGHPLPHRSTSMQTVTEHDVAVLDRHTKQTLMRLDRVRALADAYPGRVLITGGRRYRVCAPRDQTGFDDGFIYADPHQRAVTTAKIRDLVVEPAHPERRKRARRRQDQMDLAASLGLAPADAEGEAKREAPASGSPPEPDRRGRDRRAAMVHSIGGSDFLLYHPWIQIHEWVRGVKTYSRTGALLDATYYSSPIETRYRTRGAVLAFHREGRDSSKSVLHSLTHLFRHVLPAFLRYTIDDLDISYMERFGPNELPAVAFIDRHPGDAGFARAVTPEVLKHLCYWGYRLLASCPAGCGSSWGCLHCLRSLQCNADHGQPEAELDKNATLELLQALLGGMAH